MKETTTPRTRLLTLGIMMRHRMMEYREYKLHVDNLLREIEDL